MNFSFLSVFPSHVFQFLLHHQTVPLEGAHGRVARKRHDGEVVVARQLKVVDPTVPEVVKTELAEAYQAAKLFELLPQGMNQFWQMEVTYVHIRTPAEVHFGQDPVREMAA